MPTFGSSRCQPMPRPPAFRQIFHEAIQSSAGQNLSTPRWPGNPTPSRRHFTHSRAGLHSLLMTWTRRAAGDRHDASQHSSSDVCSPTEQREVLAPQRATSQAPSSSLTAATPRQSSTRMPPWRRWTTVWWTRTRQCHTCFQTASKKRKTSASCQNQRCARGGAHQF